MKKIIIAFLLLPVIFCFAAPALAIQSSLTQKSTAGISSVANANNQFCLSLYNKIKDNQNNVFFSPYSIFLSFAMVYEGARGQTANEIIQVFHFPTDDATRRSSFAKLYHQINPDNKNFNLSMANALWLEKSYPFLNSYKNIIKQYYAGNTTNLDFMKNAENSRQIINNWVAAQTNNKIKDLMFEGSIIPTTKLVLTNAVYFKGNWQTQFDPKNTSAQNFSTISGTSTKVQMMEMFGTSSNFSYAENSDVQAIELPYNGNQLSMIIILPKGNNLSLAEKSIVPQNLAQLRSNFTTKQIHLFLPKFKIETNYPDMTNTLSSMGMPTAFKNNADFSGMDGIRNLYINAVIHKAYVDVDELGTEAAAATGIGFVGGSAPNQQTPIPVVFKVDHPFIFLIEDKNTNNILFFGSVLNPNQIE